MKKKAISLITFLVFVAISVLTYYGGENSLPEITKYEGEYGKVGSSDSIDTDSNNKVIPAYKGESYVTVNDGKVDYNGKSTKTYIKLSELDSLGRCGVAESVLGPETIPTEERESIGMIRPSGWPEKVGNAKYDFIEGSYLWNRCHMLPFCLSGLNAEPRNLITGTRDFNSVYMWKFEEQALHYVESKRHHVFYKVTPIFKGDELVARGVHMEIKSIEDANLEINVFVHNVEPGIHINYMNGESYAE